MECLTKKKKGNIKDIHEHFGHHIGKTTRFFKAFFILKLKEHHLSFEQGSILFIVFQKRGASIGYIAKELEKDKTTISREVSHLCQRKLINKKINAKDKRIVSLNITQEGRKKIRSIEENLKVSENLIKSRIPREKIEICIEVLNKVAFCLEEGIEKDQAPPPVV